MVWCTYNTVRCNDVNVYMQSRVDCSAFVIKPRVTRRSLDKTVVRSFQSNLNFPPLKNLGANEKDVPRRVETVSYLIILSEYKSFHVWILPKWKSY